MALAGTRVFVALDSGAVAAAAVGGLAGGRRLRSFRRVPLPAGALAVSSLASSIARPEQVREAVGAALAGLGRVPARATLVLPDGLARLVLLQSPPGSDAREFIRFRLEPSLPWPAGEAAIDALPLTDGRVVAAAVRRATVAAYEQVLEASGLSVERVHLAPLLALPPLLRSSSRDGVYLLLGDAAASLFAVRSGAVAAVRSRRRDRTEGEPARLMREAVLTMRLAGDGAAVPRLVCAGVGAERLRDELSCAVVPAAAAGEFPEAASAAWLHGVLA